jgi:hypothetical protein
MYIHTQSRLTSAIPSLPSWLLVIIIYRYHRYCRSSSLSAVIRYRSAMLLGEVFIPYFHCASHQPAAFCCFRCEITYSLHCICLFRYFALYIIGLISSIGFYRWSVSFSFSSDLRSRYFLVANRHAIATTLISVSTGE